MKKILAIDDQKDNLTTIKAVIKSNIPNCEVQTALSGKEGIEIARNEQPDVILLDIIMPKMDGFEVCQKLKADELTKHIPIIMITAIKTDSKSRVKGLELGADAFLAKPIDAIELSAQLRVMLRIKSAEDKLRAEKEVLEDTVLERTKTIRESEEFIKRIFASSSDCIKVLDLEGNLLSMNEVGQKMLEIDDLSLYLNKPWVDFWSGKNKEAALKAISVAKNGGVATFSGRTPTAKGNLKWWENVITPINNQNGKVDKLLANSRDISERRQAEQLLRESENHLSSVMEAAKDVAFITTDLEGKDSKILSFSKGAENIFGYKADEVIGKKVAILHPKKDVDDFNTMQSNLNNETSDSTELVLIRKSGEHFPAIFSHHALYNDEGELNGTLGVSIDITDRKQAEKEVLNEKLLSEQYINSLPGLFYVFDEKKFIRWNQEWNRVTAYNDEEIALKYGADFFDGEGKKMIEEAMKKVFTHGSVVVEAEIVTKNGERIPYYFTGLRKNLNGKNYLVGLGIDITEQKKAQKNVQKLSQFRDSVIENANVWLNVLDEDSKVVVWNKAAEIISGYTRDEVMGKNEIWEWFYPDKKYRDEIMEKASAIIKKNEVLEDFETRICCKDGTYRTISWNSRNLIENNKAVGSIALGRDITQRKRAEQIQKILYNISNAVVISNSLEDLIGVIKIELNTLIDTTNFYIAFYDEKTDMFTSPFVSDEKDKFNSWPAKNTCSECVLKDAKSLLITKKQMYIMRDKGLLDFVGTPSEVWIGVPLITDGVAKGIFAVQSYTDENAYNESDIEILEFIADQIAISIERKQAEEVLKKSEERFDLAMKASEDGLYDWNLITNEVYYSPSWKRILGYEDDELPNDISIWDSLTHPKEREESLLKLQHAIENKIQHYEVEFRMKHKSGCWVNILSRANFVFNEKGKAIRVVGTHANMTEIKKAERELKFALKKATESDRLKSTFLATMSHELRTPLNAIIGFSDIINEDLPKRDIVSFNETINKSGNHLLSIVEDLFDITLIESGQVKISNENISLESILENVDEIIKIEQQKANRDNLDLSLEITQDIKNIILYTDPSKLKQILINLLKNALKFTHKGSVQYGCSIEKKDNVLKFFVKDTGIGISLEKQKFIFDVFRRVDDSNTMVYGGTGIGLSISKKLTELLGGKIWLESEEGNGAAFYFTLPLDGHKISKEEKFTAVEDQLVDSSHKQSKSHTKTILIVEDVEESFAFLKIVLEKQGFKTIWAENGKIATKYCDENKEIDLVLMDINMPVMNGFEATKLIKNFRPNLPIIAQTAYAIVGDREKSIDAGCDDYITKPIKHEALIKIVKEYL